MATTISFLHPNNTRADGFRFVFSDTASVQFMGSQAILTFGITRNPANPGGDGAEEQVAVAMTGVSLKALGYTIGRLVDNFEKSSGSIPLPDGLEQMLDLAIEEAAKSFPRK